MRVACALLVLLAAVPARADDAAVRAELIAAVQRRDVEAVRRVMRMPFDATDLRFVDPKCTREFTGHHTVIEDHELAGFVGCLADIGIGGTAAVEEGDTTYGPGAVLHLPIRDGQIAAMISVDLGEFFAIDPAVFVSHMKGFARVIVPGAALKKTIDAAADAGVVASAVVCVDKRGKVLDLDIEIEGDAAYERDIRAAARKWSVRPFLVRKQAVPACAELRVGYPEQRLTAKPPEPEAEPAPALPVPPAPPRVVAPKMLEAYRISGEAAIVPDDLTKLEIQKAGVAQVIGSFKLCLDTRGAVVRVQTLKTSGFEAYDQKLIRGMRKWRYRPYLDDGKPVPVCTAVTFVYKQTVARPRR